MTGALTRDWARPSCVAQELALRCLFDQVEVIQDLYGFHSNEELNQTISKVSEQEPHPKNNRAGQAQYFSQMIKSLDTGRHTPLRHLQDVQPIQPRLPSAFPTAT